jgi:hypothetical protein
LCIIDGIDLETLVQKRTGMMRLKLLEKVENKHANNILMEYLLMVRALRFTFCAMASTSRDIENFDLNRVEGIKLL